jgi:hypothetical protein
MKLLPFESFVIESRGNPAELAALLRPHTEPPRFLSLRRAQHEFVGKVSEQGFRIKRVVPWRASFVPEIFGRFTVGPVGTQIHVEITPSDGAMTIIAALCGSPALMVFHHGAQVVFVIVGVVLFAWLFGMVGFWLDRGAASRRLTQLLADPLPAVGGNSEPGG